MCLELRKKMRKIIKKKYRKNRNNPANIYLFKINNLSARIKCEIYSKLTVKTPERRHWRRSVVYTVNFEHILHVFLVLLLLTLNKYMLV